MFRGCISYTESWLAKAVKEICPKENCTGCGACLQVCRHSAISFVEDSEGFLYPAVSQDLCIDCGRCSAVCPNNKSYEGIRFEKQSYAVFSKEWQTHGSSGGLFSAFASVILREGGCVFGAGFDSDMQLSQTKVDNLADLGKLQGSKYLQSRSHESYAEVFSLLGAGTPVLYCGTPCQIAGLLSCMSGSLKGRLYTVDFVCHGVPSQKAFDKLLKEMSSRYGKIDDFSFRVKDRQATMPYAVCKGKRHYLRCETFSYMASFYRGFLYRESCFNCQFASLNRPADITLADFWGYRDFGRKNSRKGVSMLLVNNLQGEDLFRKVKESLCYDPIPLDLAVKLKHNLRKPSERPLQRDKTASDFLEMTLKEYSKKYNLLPRSAFVDELIFCAKMIKLRLCL